MKTRLSSLFTDLYELTMAAVYFEREMFAPATFSFFVRSYPKNWRFFIFCGLEEVISWLEKFSFSEEDLAYLDNLGLFKPAFLDYLKNLRFTGDVFSMSEGAIFFAEEPVLEITAPLPQAQLVETFVINTLCFNSLVASKAVRSVLAARGRMVVDFSARRTHGVEAALKVARNSYLVGFSATSNTLAGKLYNIPVTGTMAHSFIESFPSEVEAFSAFAEIFPDNTVLLLDTYDTITATKKAIDLAKRLEAQGKRLKGVRLDSGNISHLAKEVRRLLDEAGLSYVKIFVSGGLDEYQIEKFLEEGVPVDAFGVGTKMGVSADAPYLDASYKLVSYDGRPVAKLSSGKKTLAGEKQVYRFKKNGFLQKDLVALRNETFDAEPLLEKVMEKGKRLKPKQTLGDIKKHIQMALKEIPDELKAIRPSENSFYCVEVSPHLAALQKKIEEEIRLKEILV
ncbi:nicotinate phosphoribosyltransferase [Thermodesulfatator indicus DSM 15286]|uniref:Nicotinate phosphoribosyltransferase n=1 Tax=Thermodesulfatator indicus (strain DSM 15286 / JCM 11887 / CIR29812) TaxID=667014 RepID=F8AE16_THEID|nr:nicotinate phosphoribosyltransferase [Thermodesulfatator indicus]AEH44986.1 nicotinate phosphoribosyltransferase [Thermodesulfatator indicus DSM 15286]